MQLWVFKQHTFHSLRVLSATLKLESLPEINSIHLEARQGFFSGGGGGGGGSEAKK